MPAIIYQKASESASAAVDAIRQKQAYDKAVESSNRIQKLLDILTPENWAKAGEDWAKSTSPEFKRPSISMAVCQEDVAALKVHIRNLGYSHVTEKHIPECKDRGYEWEAHTEIRVFVEV